MKKYNIVVNGTTYQVEVEEVGGVPSAPKAAPAPAPAPVAAAPAPAPAAPAAPVAAGDKAIVSPMPGTVLDVRVSAGQAVKAGDILLILEAMKMENEILAPHDGTIDTVSVTKGASVNSGDPLVSYK
ncbi:MAG: biotin/lipoyl-containing protein [Anaerovoracaceae bacterium]|nr:biotin/lipoyl-binding protein [Clostridiales bacterium]